MSVDTALDVRVDLDEAHFVAPQAAKLPRPINLLATTGRGKGSSIWSSQRLRELDGTVISRTNARLLGGSGSDRGKLDVEYPVEVHNPETNRVPNLPTASLDILLRLKPEESRANSAV